MDQDQIPEILKLYRSKINLWYLHNETLEKYQLKSVKPVEYEKGNFNVKIEMASSKDSIDYSHPAFLSDFSLINK